MRIRPITFALLIPAATSGAQELVSASPLTRDVVLLHFDDGEVLYHGYGQTNADDRSVQSPLDLVRASQTATYWIASAQDPNYGMPRRPLSIGRKSKAEDFSRDCRWNGSQCVNDIVFEHFVYLQLPAAMAPGATYTIDVSTLAANRRTIDVLFDPAVSRSEAVHVNQIGFRPGSQKFAYVSHWMGDAGSLDLNWLDGAPFRVLDLDRGVSALNGTVALRGRANRVETGQPNDTPNQNFALADVYECDFSALRRAGRYAVAVDGVGRSFEFRIADDVYREVFRSVARGLFHHRAGVDHEPPESEWIHPADHRPDRGTRIRYTTERFIDSTSENGDPQAVAAGITGPALQNTWGWYHDAGDWDGYPTHFRVPQSLLTVYERAPTNFSDGELTLPSGRNGVPDILDEARWLVDYFRRNVGPNGGIFGARIHGDFQSYPRPIPSWEDPREWIAFGEDPRTSFRFAGIAAHLVHCLSLAGTPDTSGLLGEAVSAYSWAANNLQPGDDAKVRDARLYAAANLFRATGALAYQTQFAADLVVGSSFQSVFDFEAQRWGIWSYVMLDGTPGLNTTLRDDLRQACLQFADEWNLSAWNRRNFRFAGYFWTPMLIGQATTPWVLASVVAHHLSGDARYFDAITTSCDYFLGGNPLNMTWVTGLGDRSPQQILHLDSWYDSNPLPIPGVVPYGPHRGEDGQWVGPWDVDYARQRGVHPPVAQWPGHELWFENRYCPITNEYTVWQNIAPAAAVYGYLCGRAKQQFRSGALRRW